jgi:uncharacterized OB-fold protein
MSVETLPAFDGDGPDACFKAFLAEGKLMLQRSRRTGEVFFYPRVLTPGEGSAEWEWIEASGAGEVYATTVVRQRPEKGGSYNVALIDLAEGCRMMGRVEGVAPEDVKIGMRVTARIAEIDGEKAVVFDPA